MEIISRYQNTSNGYVKLYLSDGRIIEEHRYILEQKLGRKLLFNEVVHHLDGDKTNNNIENLSLITRGSHCSMHHNLKTIIELTCKTCGKIFEREARQIRKKMKNGQTDFYCNRSCMAKSFGRGRIKNK